MLIEVTRTTHTKEMVELELPYFYKHVLAVEDDVVIYGKIGEKEHWSVEFHDRHNYESVQIERELTDWGRLSCYLTNQHRSNAIEYEQARATALAKIQAAG